MFKFFQNLKNLKEGITLIELVFVISAIVLFSMIIVSDFPKVQRQFALSRVSYKLAQDLRRVQNLGLSGVPTYDSNKDTIAVKGYGVYFNTSTQPTQYVIYADVADADGVYDQKYSGGPTYPFCNTINQKLNGTLTSDCVIEIIDISKENSSLTIKSINAPSNTFTSNISTNFSPPSPTTSIESDAKNTYSEAGIVLGFAHDNSLTRTVWINNSGLIRVQ